MNRINRFNEWLATQITNKVGTMTCAYIFTVMILFAMVYPPVQNTVFFISSAFLQLVFLPIIMVGGDVQSRVTQKLILQINDNTMKELSEIKDIINTQNKLISLLQEDINYAKDQNTELHTIMSSLIDLQTQINNNK